MLLRNKQNPDRICCFRLLPAHWRTACAEQHCGPRIATISAPQDNRGFSRERLAPGKKKRAGDILSGA